jgi:hypothetical protein
VRADVVRRRIVGMGFAGGERTTRRAVAEVKAWFAAGQRRVFRPWIPEPGLWLQFDWREGPRIGGRRTSLWCAWLAWSRFRVVIPTFDKTLPTAMSCLDTTLRRIGGVPAYALTDNEKTVTVEHVADIRGAQPADRGGGPALRDDDVSVSHAFTRTRPAACSRPGGADGLSTPYVRSRPAGDVPPAQSRSLAGELRSVTESPH